MSLILTHNRDWPWVSVLGYLFDHFCMTPITLNYDAVLESLLYDALGVGFSAPVTDADYPIDYLLVNQIPVLKLHGSILTSYPNPSPFGHTPNPWLVDRQWDTNILAGMRTFQCRGLAHFPFLPDLVPPGFHGNDRLNPTFIVHREASRALTEANLVVACGVSGKAPDDVEIRELLGHVSDHAQFVHVGLTRNGDQDCPLAEMARERVGEGYMFLDASEVSQLPRKLDVTGHR